MRKREGDVSASRRSSSVDVRAVSIGGAAIVAAILLALGGAYLARMWYPKETDTGNSDVFNLEKTAPRLDSAPQPALDAYMREKNQQLNSWAWLDKQKGIAHIPIDVAMQILAAPATSNDKTSRGGEKR